jgi:LmbE family N-acetylglucosaminyl deacetylase
MRWIYISPHLDDAVLSAGGLIREQARAGLDVEIWTTACGFPPDAELSPFAQILHQQWGIPAAVDVVRARRAEDVHAAKILGAKTAHFDYLDCIYRRGKNGEWLYADVFVPPHEDEFDLPSRIAASIAARLRPDDNLVCQLALGAHVDHVIARRAVELLQRPIFYAADVPYLFNTPDDLAPAAVGMQETTHSISESALTAWQDAIAQYASQISSLFDSAEDMRAKIAQYAIELNGVRLWASG